MKKKLTKLEKRAAAKKMYLENAGKVEISKIAKKFGVSHRSVNNWRHWDNWAENIEVAKEIAVAKSIEVVADVFEVSFKRDLQHIKLIGDQIESKLSQEEDKLTPNDIRALTQAKSDSIKMLRLMNGESTENSAVALRKVPGRNNPTIPQMPEPPLEKLAMMAGKSDPEGKLQAMIARYIELRQEIVAVVDPVEEISY